jgi:hypothetical protein
MKTPLRDSKDLSRNPDRIAGSKRKAFSYASRALW